MRAITRINAALCVILACVATRSCEDAAYLFTTEDASSLLSAQTEALATGDTLQIKRLWSERSYTRDGFWHMYSWRGTRMHVSDWPRFLEAFTFRITSIEHADHYAAVDIEWISRSTSAERTPAEHRPMRYYVVRERGRWVLAYPIDVLTEGWLSHETDCFVFHYPKELAKDGYLADMELMDHECARAVEALAIDLGSKIDFYVARTPTECGALLDQPPAHGYAATTYPYRLDGPGGLPLVTSTSFFHPHEVMHVMQVLAGIPGISAAFSEGFAVAFGGGPVFSPLLALSETRQLMHGPEFISLRRLLAMSDEEFLRQNYITYLEAGAFVRFLIDRFGIDSLKQLANATGSPAELPSTIARVYGLSLEQLEIAWKDYLAALALPAVGHSIPDQAVEVFSMTDPWGDDVGDGDYSYPNERFASGVFDLTTFDVLKDSVRAYFRLTFRDLQRPVTYGSVTERYVPGVAIAINKGLLGERHLQQHAHGVRFPAGSGYDVKLNVGTAISVSDNHGTVHFTSGHVWHEMADARAKTISFSLPIDFIGEPTDEWEYFVGVGLATDRTMNFLYGGPTPVYQDHPGYISGGNNPDGRNPAFIDILLSEDIDQTAVLGDYDSVTAVTVQMVGGR